MIARDLAAPAGGAAELRLGDDRLVRRARDATPEPGLLLAPGWIDVQVNGFAGVDLNVPGLEPHDLEAMVARLHAVGVTRFLPTVITAPRERMAACLRAIARARRASEAVRRAVAGIHLEGPFISPEEGARGAHPADAILPPDEALFGALQEAAEDGIRLVTLAPERPGAIPFVRRLRERGVVVALGHTLADGAAVRAAVEAGARLSTHLGNGAPATLPRHPNVIWEQLAEDRLAASAIFDGHHLPDSVMRVLWRVKGPDRLILTSDAVALAGRPPGVYDGQVGGTVELHPDGRLTMHGTDYLAGSASSLLDGVRTAVERVGVAPERAVAMAGRTPAALLGLPPRDDATLVRFGPAGPEVLLTVADGRVVFAAEEAREALGGG